jgi:hypothetical protein
VGTPLSCTGRHASTSHQRVRHRRVLAPMLDGIFSAILANLNGISVLVAAGLRVEVPEPLCSDSTIPKWLQLAGFQGLPLKPVSISQFGRASGTSRRRTRSWSPPKWAKVSPPLVLVCSHKYLRDKLENPTGEMLCSIRVSCPQSQNQTPV